MSGYRFWSEEVHSDIGISSTKVVLRRLEARFASRIERQFFCYAQVAKLVDALASGASPRKGVEVQVLSWAPKTLELPR